MISALKWIRWNIIKVFSEMFGFLIENSEYLKLVVKKEGEPQFLPISTIHQAQQLHAMSEQRPQAELAQIERRSSLQQLKAVLVANP